MSLPVYDSIVIGAGFAGLSAALALQKRGQRVAVLEARDRVGGRSLSAELDTGVIADFGAQWVSPLQPRVSRLIRDYNLSTYTTPANGKCIVEYRGGIRYDTPQEVQQLYALLDGLSQEINLHTPWTHPQAATWDALLFSEWLAKATSSLTARSYAAREIAGGVLARKASDASLLTVLFCIVAAGGVQALLGTEDGAQAECVQGGTQRLAQCMANELGENVHLNQAVVAIEYGEKKVKVTTAATSFSAHSVVVALPPTVALGIVFTPHLSAQHRGLLACMPAGNVLKMHVQYATPFWHGNGLSGIAQTSQGYVYEVYANELQSKPPYLTVFSYGDEADELRGMDALLRSHIILQELAALFGPTATQALSVHAFDWSRESTTMGGFSGHMAPRGWTTFGPLLREVSPPLYWAGTEWATRWNGYIEGAITSGEHVADKVMITQS